MNSREEESTATNTISPVTESAVQGESETGGNTSKCMLL